MKHHDLTIKRVRRTGLLNYKVIKIIIFILIINIVSGCATYKSYKTTIVSNNEFLDKKISFPVSSLRVERKLCNDKKYLSKLKRSDSQFSLDYYEYLVDLQDYLIDSTMDYYLISVIYDYFRKNTIRVNLIVDSVIVSFDRNSEIIDKKLMPHQSKKEGYTEQLAISPIGIPKKYKGSFFVSFNLVIEYLYDPLEIKSIPVQLKCDPYKITTVPLLQGE